MRLISSLVGIDRIVFKDNQTLEEGEIAWHLTPALYLHQRRIVILTSFSLLLLQLHQPGSKFSLGRNADANGQRVNKVANHLLRANEICRTTGNDRAEYDIALTTIEAQKERPGPLNDGIQRQLIAASKAMEGRS